MTIHDIARIAGVSASTVSKIMNGKDKDISDETRNKVLKIIEEEQYVPYSKFREKEGLKNHLVGLIIQETDREKEAIIRMAEKASEEKGYGLLISHAKDESEVPACMDRMRKKQISGLLVDSRFHSSVMKSDQAVVYLGSSHEFDSSQKTAFYYRLSDAGRLAASVLIAKGHQRIACIVYQEEHAITVGVKEMMEQQGLAAEENWNFEGKNITEIDQYGVRQCLLENVTAVICGSPDIACCVWKQAERMKRVIPDDLSVISVGDSRILEILGDGISAVRLPADEMAKEAVKYLIDMMQDGIRPELMRKFAPSVVERSSIDHVSTQGKGEKIVVVGSMNMDIFMEVPKIPVNGETLLAERLSMYPGGKGGNQAVGAGKLGGDVYMIGCLGNDADGKQLYASLTDNNVHMDGVLFDKALPSGKAYISVDKKGESSITVFRGANASLDVMQISKCKYLFQNARYCLLSLEIPEDIAEYTIKFCHSNQTEIILKPSTVAVIHEELYQYITYFVPNEKELHLFVPGKQSIEQKAEILREKGVENVIVTLGSRGCYLRNAEISMYFKGTGFEPVDTTGGADSFISAMAVYLSEGYELIASIGRAIYASGLTVKGYGVQPALPDRKTVDMYAEEIDLTYGIK